MKKDDKYFSDGFTIVELLVVIVVIGILAAIVVVSYQGISNRAIAGSLQSDLKNATTRLAMDKSTSDDGNYPATEGDANGGLGLPKSSDTDYSYTVSSGEYCISATSVRTGVAYRVSSDNGTIEEGDCGAGGPTGVPPAGDGLAFDGEDDYVRIPSSASLNITNNLTIETWVYPSSVSADNDWRTVVGKLEGGTGGYEIGVDVDQSVLFFNVQVSGGIVYTSYNFPTLDTWYHVVGAFQAGPTMKLYVDGALVNDAPQTFGLGPSFNGNLITSSKSLYIGGDPMDSSYCPREFAGEVDEVRIYNRILSDIEVGEHYAATFNDESNLVGLWHFDEGSGSTIVDASGNGNNGVIVAPASGNYAMSFDGNGDYVTVPDSASLDLTGQFTIEAWIKRDSVAQLSDWRLIIGKRNSVDPKDVYGWTTDTNFFGLTDCTDGDGQCSIAFYQSSSGGIWLPFPDTLNEWHHLVTTYNRTANRTMTYWDYDLIEPDTTYNDATVGDGVLYIGGNGSGSGVAPYDFAGDLDEIRLYGKELPSVIVKAHLLGDFTQDATGCGGNCDLRAHWRFDEGSGGTVVDSSGNGNGGVISGNPQWVSVEMGAQRTTH